jgi:ATP adenylyltransferase
MTSTIMEAVAQRSVDALASGALQPLRVEQLELEDGGLQFIVRWASTLAHKDGRKAELPGGPRDPDFNPFLTPEPALTVGALGEGHVIILNKFPVCRHHLVLARKLFFEQLSPLELEDFAALAAIMSTEGGLGFYNGGAPAGASQRHKHVQWIPADDGNASLRGYSPRLPANASELSLASHPALPIRHCFVRVNCGAGVPAPQSAQSMLAGFHAALQNLEMLPDADGLLPPFNLLLNDGWMLMVPRSQEHFNEISINALSYGGTIYVRHKVQIDAIREAGALGALAAVGVA